MPSVFTIKGAAPRQKKEKKTMKDYELVGNVDLFGLDEFGAPGDNPMWGTLAGTIFQSGGAAAVRAFTGAGKWSELIGAGLGAGVGGIMWAAGRRAGGMTAIVTSLLTGGIRFMEQQVAPAAAGTNGVGLVDIERQYALGRGLGLVDIEKQYALGSAQQMGQSGLPTLVGDRPHLVGGPTVDGLGKHFGATLFGS